MQPPVVRNNMYKYIALCGVAVMIITLVFSVSKLYRVEDQILNVKERIEIMATRLEAGRNTEGGETGSELEQALDRIRLKSARNRLEVLENRSLEMRQWATISFTIGIVVTAFGFTRWYRKIQMPMERIAQQQAEQHVTRADSG